MFCSVYYFIVVFGGPFMHSDHLVRKERDGL